jgi:N-methylhydantoinase B
MAGGAPAVGTAGEFFLTAREVDQRYGVDLTTAETIRSGLIETTRHMRDTLMRGAFSNVVREVLDFGVCVYLVDDDRSAEMVAITEGCNHFAFTLQHMANMVCDEWGIDNLGPGDTIVCNDSWRGSIHFPDVNMFRPVFVDGELVFLLSDASHLVDIGGPVPGGFNNTATTMYEEGLRIPPMLITSGNEPVRSTMNLIIENTRAPVHTLGDLRALFGTLRVGERRVLQMVETYGVEHVRSGCRYTLDLAERRMRKALAETPDGTYDSEILLDDDGKDKNVPLRLTAQARVSGTHVEIDFSGTDRQAEGSTTTCWEDVNRCLIGPKQILDPHHPMNAGAMRPFHVLAPAGSLIMGLPPTSQSQHVELGTHIASLMVGLFGKMRPDRAVATDTASAGAFVFSGSDSRTGRVGRPFAGITIAGGAWGGTSSGDGISFNTSPIYNVSCTNVEYFERDTPMAIRGMSGVIDAAGPGTFRSGVPSYIAFEALYEPAEMSTIMDSGRFPHLGLHGGGSGMGTILLEAPLSPGNRFEQWNGLVALDACTRIAGRFDADGMPSPDGDWCENTFADSLKISEFALLPGRVLLGLQGGGGGYGDPRRRDPDLVRRDVWNELISVERARELYCVAIDPQILKVDETETARLRSAAEAQTTVTPYSTPAWPRTTCDLDRYRDRGYAAPSRLAAAATTIRPE